MKFVDFAQLVRPECHGAPDFIIERAVLDSAIDFCKRTGVYIPEPEEVSVIKGINEYEVSIPSGTELNYITDVFADKTKLSPVSFPKLLEMVGDGNTRGVPSVYSQRDNAAFFVAPIPDTTDTLRVLYSLKPSPTSSSIPDTIGRENREAIVQGAIYRLQMMPGQAFSNPGAAANNKMLFEREVGRALRQVKYGFSGGSLKVRYRQFI